MSCTPGETERPCRYCGAWHTTAHHIRRILKTEAHLLNKEPNMTREEAKALVQAEAH